MPRLPRYFAPGHTQHVIQRGNNRCPTFRGRGDYAFYLRCLEDARTRYDCAVHAYVLMPNHVHLLLTPRFPDGIARMMQLLGSRYVRFFNRKHERTGTLWEGRYRATLVDTERYLLACSRYIEMNPVRACISEHPREYRWSSYRGNALGERDDLLEPHPLYRSLGVSPRARCEAYRALFDTRLGPEMLNLIRTTANGAWTLGSHAFRASVEPLVRRRTAPLPRGRPSSGIRRVSS